MLKIKEVTEEQKNFLRNLYPTHGKRWCMETFGLTEGQVRSTVHRMGLKQDRKSDFFKEWQKRAGESKIGKKYPNNSLSVKRAWEEGLMTPTKRSAMIEKRICVVCGKGHIEHVTYTYRKNLCSVACRKIYEKTMWKRNPHPRGMKGKHHTDEVKARMSKKHMGVKKPRESIIRGLKTRVANGWVPCSVNRSWKAGRAEDLGDIWFRSAWERNYARYLNFLIKQGQIEKWDFEKVIFWFEGIKRGCVSYKPDFRVYLKNGEVEFHEVKGWMDAGSKTRLKRMKKYYPKIKVILVDGPAYKSIARYGKTYSKFWE